MPLWVSQQIKRFAKNCVQIALQKKALPKYFGRVIHNSFHNPDRLVFPPVYLVPLNTNSGLR